jgi:hypothetical protein
MTYACNRKPSSQYSEAERSLKQTKPSMRTHAYVTVHKMYNVLYYYLSMKDKGHPHSMPVEGQGGCRITAPINSQPRR